MRLPQAEDPTHDITAEDPPTGFEVVHARWLVEWLPDKRLALGRMACSAAAAGPSSGSRHCPPGQVRAVVGHEPPVVEVLPDSVQVRAQTGDIYEMYPAHGAEKAMRKFTAHAGLGGT